MADTIFRIFRESADPDRAQQMAAYMRNKFEFLGLMRADRDLLQKEVLQSKKALPAADWEWISQLYDQPEREFHMLAVDYLRAIRKKLTPEDLPKIEALIRRHSWWDSVDALSDVVGTLVKKYPFLLGEALTRWVTDENFWIRRAAIIHQLKFKEETDREFLEFAISSNLGSKEFFINKAIGWALRQYSRTDADWVREFLTRYDLAPLSVREASKYI